MTAYMNKWLTVRKLLGVGILLLAGTLAVVVIRNFQESTPEKIIAKLPGNIDLSLKQINYTETRNGIKQWSLKADSAAHAANGGVTQVQNIHMIFYAQGELGDITLTAKHGQLITDPKMVKVDGDVVIRSSKGYTLYTQHLVFHQTTNLIETNDPVRLVTEKLVVTGKGMRMNTRAHKLSLSSDVETTIAGERGGGKKK